VGVRVARLLASIRCIFSYLLPPSITDMVEEGCSGQETPCGTHRTKSLTGRITAYGARMGTLGPPTNMTPAVGFGT
jgi:hypothetical protein